MPQAPLISFIIPVYNLPAGMVKTCLDSLLSLPLGPHEREIWVIDDGSERPLEGELETSYRAQIHLIRQANGGLSAARNTGLDRASGEYIQFVDGDDALVPEAYATCLEWVRKCRPDWLFFGHIRGSEPAIPKGKGAAMHPEGAVGTDGPKGIGAERKARPTKVTNALPTNFCTGIEYLGKHNLHASAWGYLFARKLLDKGLRFTPGLLHEDEEFTPLLLLQARRVAATSLPAYHYRIRPGSITLCPDKAHLRKRFADKLYVIKRLKDEAKGAWKKALTRRWAQMTMDLVYDTYALSHRLAAVNEAIRQLKQEGLIPLPMKGYTPKYGAFATLLNLYAGCLSSAPPRRDD